MLALTVTACASRPTATAPRDEPTEPVATAAPTPDAAPAIDAAPDAPAIALPAPAADDDDPNHDSALHHVEVTVERMYGARLFLDPLPGYDDAVTACFRAIPRADRPPTLALEGRVERPPIDPPTSNHITTHDPRFTACVASVLPTADQLHDFDVADRPHAPGSGPGSAVAFVARGYTRTAAEREPRGRIIIRKP